MAHFTSNTYTLKREILTFSNKISNKGKIKMPLYYKGKNHDAYLSHVKVQVTASGKDICLVLVYGITEHPMMLAANKKNQFQGRQGIYPFLTISFALSWPFE